MHSLVLVLMRMIVLMRVLRAACHAQVCVLQPMADAMPLKLARLEGRIACPLLAGYLLFYFVSAKISESPWTRKGAVWEWTVNDIHGSPHEARPQSTHI